MNVVEMSYLLGIWLQAFFLIGYLILVFGAGFYASRLERFEFFYMVIALVCTPLVAYALLYACGPNKAKIENLRLKVSEKTEKECPDCAEFVRLKAARCRYCSYSFVNKDSVS
jgi:hypothetical protein